MILYVAFSEVGPVVDGTGRLYVFMSMLEPPFEWNSVPHAPPCVIRPVVVDQLDEVKGGGLVRRVVEEPSESQITAALSAACLMDTPVSRRDMRNALSAAWAIVPWPDKYHPPGEMFSRSQP